MRYFTVEKEVMRCAPVSYGVNSDGTQNSDEWEQDIINELTTGFSVIEYDENGVRGDTDFYPVQTDATNWTNNEAEVLEKIKADHPASEWQNNEW